MHVAPYYTLWITETFREGILLFLELELFISNNHNDKKDTLEENAMTPRLLF
jgi:hypothetical protein